MCTHDNCTKRYPTAYQLKQHQLVHDNAAKRVCVYILLHNVYNNDKCVLFMQITQTVMRHNKQTILLSKRFDCLRNGCNKSFKSTRDWQRHQLTHDNISTQVFVFLFCICDSYNTSFVTE